MKQFILALSAVAVLSGCISQAKADTVSGTIAVYSGATLIGYVEVPANGFYTVSTLANALSVTIDTAAIAPFSISETTPPDASYPYLGYAAGYYNINSMSTVFGYAFLTGTTYSAPGATPSADDAVSDPAESSVWFLSGNQLTSDWVDSDGSVSSATLFYNRANNYLGETSNLADYEDTFRSDRIEAVTFEFTENVAPPPATPEPSSFVLMLTGLAGAAGAARRKFRR